MTQIRLPLGMRDLILDEAAKKRQLQKQIEDVFQSYGYDEVIAPTIEYLETYQKAFVNLNVQEMYKFFDADSDILSLRVDMTVPIARICASKFKDARPPYRFRYCSNVFKVRESFAGKRSEVTDCGIECIGLDDKSDLEVLCLALDTMACFGQKDYVLEIGMSTFFDTACGLTGLDEGQRKKLAALIDNKSLVELDLFLSELSVSEDVRAFFTRLPLLNGDASILSEAASISFDPALKQIIVSLQKLYEQLEQLGYHEHISFDLGKVPHLNYYTGILFEGFVQGVGVSVLSGGRYDTLLKVFGTDLPACGFSVKLDYLLDVVSVQRREVTVIYYPAEAIVEANRQARTLRKEKKEVILIPEEIDEIVIRKEQR